MKIVFGTRIQRVIGSVLEIKTAAEKLQITFSDRNSHQRWIHDRKQIHAHDAN